MPRFYIIAANFVLEDLKEAFRTPETVAVSIDSLAPFERAGVGMFFLAEGLRGVVGEKLLNARPFDPNHGGHVAIMGEVMENNVIRFGDWYMHPMYPIEPSFGSLTSVFVRSFAEESRVKRLEDWYMTEGTPWAKGMTKRAAILQRCMQFTVRW